MPEQLFLFRNFTGGNLPLGWSPSNISNACDWLGVECHADGHIKKLRIGPDYNSGQKPLLLNSTYPVAISLLPNLQFLDCIDAGFYGRLPSDIFTPSIININFGSNLLTGEVCIFSPSRFIIENSLSINISIVSKRYYECHATTLHVRSSQLPWPCVPRLMMLFFSGIYENIFTSLPVPEILQFLAKSSDPRTTEFVFSRNSLNCSSFHPGLFVKKDEFDPICDITFAMLPIDSNGNICGFPQAPESGYFAGCKLRPSVKTSFTPRPLPPTPWILKSDKMQVEVQGSRLTFYGIMRNGTVYRDEFVAIGTP
jgi:hypothetical protein